jgi:hypothetical protein
LRVWLLALRIYGALAERRLLRLQSQRSSWKHRFIPMNEDITSDEASFSAQDVALK